VRCNYAFFTTREAIVGPVDESLIPPDPEGRPIPRTQPMATPPAYQPPPYAPPRPRPRPSAPPPFEPAPEAFEPVGPAPPPKKGAKPKKRAKTGGFLRIPEGLDDKGLEALRYTVMRQGVIVLIVLLGVSIGVNALLGFLRIRIPGIGIAGAVEYVIVFVFYLYVKRVAKATAKPVSNVEKLALGKVRVGGFTLALIPIIGSPAGELLGWYYQTTPMFPAYYLMAAYGIYSTVSGVTGLKERYSYFGVFEFAMLLLLLYPLAALLGEIRLIFGNAYWYQSTFFALTLGFVAVAFALRKMRAGQYESLEIAMASGQKAMATRQYDVAVRQFDRGVTISHSLYSDKLFKTTRSGGRALPPDYYNPWLGKASALAAMGKGSKALAILDLILEVDSSNTDLWMAKGEILMTIVRPAEAYVAFETALRLNPNMPGAFEKKQASLSARARRID
jgi:hypothetical protein